MAAPVIHMEQNARNSRQLLVLLEGTNTILEAEVAEDGGLEVTKNWWIYPEVLDGTPVVMTAFSYDARNDILAVARDNEQVSHCRRFTTGMECSSHQIKGDDTVEKLLLADDVLFALTSADELHKLCIPARCNETTTEVAGLEVILDPVTQRLHELPAPGAVSDLTFDLYDLYMGLPLEVRGSTVDRKLGLFWTLSLDPPAVRIANPSTGKAVSGHIDLGEAPEFDLETKWNGVVVSQDRETTIRQPQMALILALVLLVVLQLCPFLIVASFMAFIKREDRRFRDSVLQ